MSSDSRWKSRVIGERNGYSVTKLYHLIEINGTGERGVQNLRDRRTFISSHVIPL